MGKKGRQKTCLDHHGVVYESKPNLCVDELKARVCDSQIMDNKHIMTDAKIRLAHHWNCTIGRMRSQLQRYEWKRGKQNNMKKHAAGAKRGQEGRVSCQEHT